MNKQETNQLISYLPWALKGILVRDLTEEFEDCDWVTDVEMFSKNTIWQYAGYCDESLCLPLGEGDFSGFLIKNKTCYTSVGNSVKPLLRRLSDLLIDDSDIRIQFDNELNEFDSRFMREAIVNGTSYIKDIHYTFELQTVLLKLHFDIYGLIDSGVAMDINTLKP